MNFKIPHTNFLLLFFFTSLCLVSKAQNFDSLYQKGIQLELSLNEKLALSKFKEAQKIQPLNLASLYKCSELCNRIGARESDPVIKEQYFNSALAYAKIAYAHFPQSDDANVAMCMALGRIALTKSGREKVVTVNEIKQYAERAIKINPNNFKAWHVIGKWHYEISSLNFVEQVAVKVFYGGFPESSFEESIKAYETAKSINPYFSLNYLELAKAYKKNDNIEKAKFNLKKIATIPNYNEDDKRIKNEALVLLKKWN